MKEIGKVKNRETERRKEKGDAKNMKYNQRFNKR